eukprot:RCo045422
MGFPFQGKVGMWTGLLLVVLAALLLCALGGGSPASLLEPPITLLLVSDSHRDFGSLARIKRWLAHRQVTVDHVLFAGDFTNLGAEDQSNPAAVQESEGCVARQLAILSSIAPSGAFVPGNHDPAPMFNRSGAVGESAPGTDV